MSKYIKPTLSFTSNVESATTDPGIMSIALALNTIPNADANGRITVDGAKHGQSTVTTTRAILGSDFGNFSFDGSAIHGATTSMDPGTDGGIVYIKNTDTTTGNNIHVGIVAPAHASNDPATPATDGATSSLDGTTQETLRTMTLKPGEFAFFPWDYTGDIWVESAQNSPILEWWVFDRG